MKQYAIVFIFFVLVSASCGGGQSSAEAPPAATEEVAEPAGETEAAESPEAEAAPEPDQAESKASEPEASAAEASKGDDKGEVEVKEAIEARITDKHIVISGKVLFGTGNAKLKKVSFAVLDEVVAALRKHPEIIKLQVVGHTDSDGDAKANIRLSKRRATAVMKYLVKKGIERDRLSAIGMGEDNPIASNDTEEGKDKNRRVEFLIVERVEVRAVHHSSATTKPGKVESRKATDDETEELIKEKNLDKKF